MEFMGHGVYGLSEVARFTRTKTDRVRAWFLGRKDGPGPIIRDGTATGPQYCVSFLGLIDALVVAKLRDDHGVSLQYLRKVHERLIAEFDVVHPFSRKDFFTDGKKVFVSFADDLGEEKMKELLTRQQAFPSVLRQYLTHVEYDKDTLLAQKWHIAKGVVIDPARHYGKPIVETANMPTGILGAAYRSSHNNLATVAEWYDVSVAAVKAAVAFERGWGILAA